MTTTATEPQTDVRAMTVPDLAKALDWPLDRLRLTIRRNEPLQKLLIRIGPVRVLPAGSLDEFRAALTSSSPPSIAPSPACAAT